MYIQTGTKCGCISLFKYLVTPSKFAPVQSRTLDIRGTPHVAIVGAAYRQAITATFGITFANGILPMQLIYGGKTERSKHT